MSTENQPIVTIKAVNIRLYGRQNMICVPKAFLDNEMLTRGEEYDIQIFPAAPKTPKK
jgi:hypothetical protein